MTRRDIFKAFISAPLAAAAVEVLPPAPSVPSQAFAEFVEFMLAKITRVLVFPCPVELPIELHPNYEEFKHRLDGDMAGVTTFLSYAQPYIITTTPP
jgi:hypothetical protein